MIATCIVRLCRLRTTIRSIGYSSRLTSSWSEINTFDERKDSEVRGYDWKRANDKEEEECLYPAIRFMGVTTVNRTHSFEATTDKLIKMIKLGAINKNMAKQYCHYLADLSRDSSPEDSLHYARRCQDLMIYLLKNDKDMPLYSKNQLLVDVANTNEDNFKNTCDNFISFNSDVIHPTQTRKLLSLAYKYRQWDYASKILDAYKDKKLMHVSLCDPFASSIIEASKLYLDPEKQEDYRLNLKKKVIEHIYQFLHYCQEKRVQFIIKTRMDFIQALDDFGFKVIKTPTIKMSGRCTGCDSHVPMYDDKNTRLVHDCVRVVLHHGADKGLYLNADPREIQRFEEYLENLQKFDKRPIDVVVDGLNIAYKNTQYYYVEKTIGNDFKKTTRKSTHESYKNILINTLLRNNMLQQFRKILIIGKEHMRAWPGLLDFFDKQKIYYYLSKNETKDDLFQILAASKNSRTILLTNDFFRDHLSAIEGEGKVALMRWIDTHQACLSRKKLKINWPTPYEKIPSVDRDTNTFHIPVIDYDKLNAVADHEPPPHLNEMMTMWICCKTS